MSNLHTINGKPVEETKAAAAPAKKSTHAEGCGDVGETGEHGDLGSNAAK